MKEVPRQCGALGRFRPAPSALPQGAHGTSGTSSPHVRVRAMPQPGRAVQPLRPRSPLLHPGVLAPGPRRRTVRDCAALPVQPRRSDGPRGSLAALANAPAAYRSSAARGAARKHRDAPGLPGRAGRCSTGRMDLLGDAHPVECRRPRGHRGGARAGCAAALPALRRGRGTLGPPGLPAPMAAGASQPAS